MEDKFLRKILFSPPYGPSNAGVHQPVLVPTDIDALDERQAEIPFQIREHKRRNETATGCINVNGCVPAAPPDHSLVKITVLAKLASRRCTGQSNHGHQ